MANEAVFNVVRNTIKKVLLASLSLVSAMGIAEQSASAYGPRTTPSGAPIRWHRDQVSVGLDASVLGLDPAVKEVIKTGLLAWRGTGATLPSLTFEDVQGAEPGYTGKTNCSVVYRPGGFAPAKNALAITLITYDDKSGEILDAHVVFNGGTKHPFAILNDANASDKTDKKTGTQENGQADDKSKGDAESSSHDTEKTPAPSKAAYEFDVQSVITHEGGHFFGITDLPDSPKATMFPITASGQTYKRVLAEPDKYAITTLYSMPAPSNYSSPSTFSSTVGAPDPSISGNNGQSQGCGGAHIAPGQGAGQAQSVLGLGFALFGIAFLRRADATRSRRGVALLSVGATLLLSPPVLATSSSAMTEGNQQDQSLANADATAQVAEAHVTDEKGVFRTELKLIGITCHAASCPAVPHTVNVWGGTKGDLTQIVGHEAAPRVGDRIAFRLSGARSWVDVLGQLH